MKREDGISLKRVPLTVRIGGRKRPVKKEAVVCVKSGKILRFVDKDNSR